MSSPGWDQEEEKSLEQHTSSTKSAPDRTRFSDGMRRTEGELNSGSCQLPPSLCREPSPTESALFLKDAHRRNIFGLHLTPKNGVRSWSYGTVRDEFGEAGSPRNRRDVLQKSCRSCPEDFGREPSRKQKKTLKSPAERGLEMGTAPGSDGEGVEKIEQISEWKFSTETSQRPQGNRQADP